MHAYDGVAQHRLKDLLVPLLPHFSSHLGLNGRIGHRWTCPRTVSGQKMNKIGAIFTCLSHCQHLARAWVKTTLSTTSKTQSLSFPVYDFLQLLARTCKYPAKMHNLMRKARVCVWSIWKHKWTFGWVIQILFLQHWTPRILPSKNNSPYWKTMLNMNSEWKPHMQAWTGGFTSINAFQHTKPD